MEGPGENVSAPTRGETSLWRDADFMKFWLSMNVSFAGTSVASLAYPLTAVLILQATPGQMGLLRATGSAASFLAGPFAGVLADRARRRPLLIGSDLGLALLALSIPAAHALGLLRIEQMYVVQFLAGMLTIVGDVTLMAYLPSLVSRVRLTEANSHIQASSSAVSIAGPGAAGVLVQTLGAPVVILFDAVSFVLSSACVWLIRTPEPEPEPRAEGESVWTQIAEGLRFVYGHATLRPLAEGIAIHFLFAGMVYTVFVLYAVRELGVTPAPLGLVLAALGPGFLLGALLAPRAARRFGVGPVIMWSTLLPAAGMGLMPLARGGTAAVVSTLAAAHFLMALGIQLNGVNLVSLRQSITPHRLQGRMNASFRYVNLLAAAVGALAAGWLGETIGLRATIAVGACGLLLHFLRLFLSPVRRLREHADAEKGDK